MAESDNKHPEQGKKAEEAAKKESNESSGVDETEKLKDSFLRLAAEFDNYKKRTANEIINAKTIGKAEFIKKLLPVIDEFEIAVASTCNSDDKGIAKGMELVYANFLDTLKKEGLSKIQVEGKYDPYNHEIMMTKESDEAAGTIIAVVKNGYMFNGILLRPAVVIVAAEKSAKEKEKGKADEAKK